MAQEQIAFGPFRLDLLNQCLWCEKKQIPLPPKEFSLLLYLIRRPGQLVTKEQLIEAVWPDTIVGDGVLKVTIRKIRAVLNDDPRSPRFIETAHRRGYRFIGTIAQPSGALGLDSGILRRESGRLSWSAPLRLPSLPVVDLVGREQALNQLNVLLKRVRSSERQILFITGEAGIGKTTLVEAFLQKAGGDPNLWIARGQCLEQYGSGEAYLPVLEAVSRLCQEPGRGALIELLRRQAPTWLQQLPWLIADEDRENLQRAVIGATRERMLREIAEVLEALTARTPLVLVLEDLHWSDYSTLDLVSYLARRRKPAQLLLIATYRPVDVAITEHPLKGVKQELQAHRLCEEMALEYLDGAGVAEYLAARFPNHALPDALAPLLHHRTDGNPFFLVNAVDYLVAEGLIARREGSSRLSVELSDLELGVPESIRQMIEKQIDRIDRDLQRLLEVAAVAGVEFSTIAVAAGLEQDLMRVEEQCEQLERQHLFLRPTGVNTFRDGNVTARYGFIHALYQEVLYHRISVGRRAAFHQRIGERGEEVFGEYAADVAGELAMHFELGHDYRRAVTYLRTAAQNHFLRYANREAIAYLGRALELIEHWPEQEQVDAHMAVLEQAGLARRAMGDMAGAAADFEALTKYAAEQGRLEDEVKALVHLSTALSWVDRERCLSAAERFRLLSRDLTNDLLRAHVDGCWGYWHVLFLNWGDEHATALAQAVGAARKAGEQEMLGLHLARHSFFQSLKSDYASAVEAAQEGARVALELSDAHSYLLSRFYQAWALLHLGQWGEMRRILDHGLEMAERNEHRRWEVLFRLELGWLHEQAFDFSGARQLCEKGVEQALRIGHTYTESLGLVLLGMAQIGLKEYDAAFISLQAVEERLDRGRMLMDWVLRMLLHYARGRYWLARRNHQPARVEAERLCEIASSPGERTYLAFGYLMVSEIEASDENWPAAESAIGKALSVLERGGAPLAEWRVYAAASALYERLGRPSDAVEFENRSAAGLNEIAESLEKKDALRASLLRQYAVGGIQ
ncbi:MAG TPA: AAA family ATPase [Blastocatellia bacterium]|nr:AAA family ATPase [Blastocatellia bacterium]